MIIHTVILRLKRPVADGQRQQFIKILEEFGRQAPHAEGPAKVYADLQLRPEGNSVSEVLMEVNFTDAEAFQRYLADARHQELVEDVLLPRCESWLSVQAESA